MNEQLVVKNFGPIKDATVDFKRVTVFIGPTGGGKSTLAKLAAVFRDTKVLGEGAIRKSLTDMGLSNHFKDEACLTWASTNAASRYENHQWKFATSPELEGETTETVRFMAEKLSIIKELQNKFENEKDSAEKSQILEKSSALLEEARTISLEYFSRNVTKSLPAYIPSERIFAAAIEYSWAGLMRDDIGLPKVLLEFSNVFSLSRKEIPVLNIPFLNVKYEHINGRDFIRIPEREEPLMLLETASGIQSVTPLLVLLEHLSRNTEQAQSFIIEEPELNLYPTAQQGLLNWLVEKCTKGENDLTITTHSPYILSHLNLLLYAYQVAEQHPERREEVASIVPEVSWINPKEFACYQVENGGVQSLVDDDLGLIDNNELDALSGDAADAFDNLIRLSKAVAAK